MKYENGKMNGIRIAYIGGGSRGWAWGLMSDLVYTEDISGEVRLYDIDIEAARKNEIIGNMHNSLSEAKSVWTYRAVNTPAEALSGADLILSAGDLPASYLSYLTCFTSAPVLYVHGNHDDAYLKNPPEGCLCVDGKILMVKGVRILGLGGSFRYRPDAVNMYTEQEMASRIKSSSAQGTLGS